MPYRMTPSVRHRAIEVYYYYYYYYSCSIDTIRWNTRSVTSVCLSWKNFILTHGINLLL